MLVKLLKSTKYKKKMLPPGTHDVIQKSAKEWIKIGIAVEVVEGVVAGGASTIGGVDSVVSVVVDVVVDDCEKTG